MNDAGTSLADFLSAVAAKQPTPGGGAVAAAAGALAAAMGQMVLAYSVGKKGLEPHQTELADALHQLESARKLLLQLMVEDQVAYAAATAAKKANDPSVVAPAVLAAIRVPQSIAATASAVLEQARRVTPIANRWLLSDLAVCAELAMAAVRCGVYNVRVNLADVPDEADRRKLREWCSGVVSRSTQVVAQTIPAIWQRLES